MSDFANPNPPRPEAHLHLDALSVLRGGKTALHDLSLTARFARLGVLGRNGSGKSTLARVLAGLLPVSKGELRLNGIDPARDRRAALTEVGILFQNPDHQLIFPTVMEELTFGLRQLGQSGAEATDRAQATLARFGKAHWKAAAVASLSQGQKHLLCLMAVEAMGPRLLILDEPFAGLDIPTRAQLHRALALYHGAVIHITHRPEDIAAYDLALWLEAGRIRETGPAQAVSAAYLAEMTRLGAADDLSYLPG